MAPFLWMPLRAPLGGFAEVSEVASKKGLTDQRDGKSTPWKLPRE